MFRGMPTALIGAGHAPINSQLSLHGSREDCGWGLTGMCVLLQRYMEAKAKKEEAGPQASPPSAPPQRAQRPRTAGAGECIPAPSLLWLGPVSWQGAPVCVRGHA